MSFTVCVYYNCVLDGVMLSFLFLSGFALIFKTQQFCVSIELFFRCSLPNYSSVCSFQM